MERYNPYELRRTLIPEFIFGSGAMETVDMWVKDLGAKKVFVATDPGVLKAGWAEIADRLVKNAGLKFVLFSEISQNPKDSEVRDGAGLFRKEGCDLILAVGGGSVIDCAKGIAAVSAGLIRINEFEGEELVPLKIPRLICIPTTAGTSSDISRFAMIISGLDNRKFVIKSTKIIPRVSLIDSITTTTLSPEQTAAAGMCALTNAIEAYVSTAGSPVTDMHALRAVNIVCHNLVPAIEHHYDLRYRDRMMLASVTAGMAFSNSGGGLVHAMAGAVTAATGRNHGECAAVLLEHVVRYNFYSSAERYTDIARAMGVDTEGMGHDRVRDALTNEISELRNRAGISLTLKEMGVSMDMCAGLSAISEKGIFSESNPREAGSKEIEGIFTKAL